MTTTTSEPTGSDVDAQRAPSARASSARRPQLSDAERLARFEADMEATRNEQACRLALAIAKRVTEEGILCPKCDKLAPKGKFKIHPDGGWKHFGSEGCAGDAVRILQIAGIPTGDAVRVLLGKPTRNPIEVPDNLAELASRFVGVKSTIRLPIFNGVLIYGQKTGGVEAAQEFYGTWHISPEAVAESGAVMITDPKHFEREILKAFGEDKLLDCGLFTRTASNRLYSLVNDRFPVVEPHRHPATGDVLYMQFRASHAQYERYLEHKAGKREYKGSEKIISIKGAPVAAQVGTGLPRLETLPPGQDVYIVEGYKDMLAARTFGLEAYGLPGAGVWPPAKVIQLLARHRVFVAFDGDEAGAKGREALVTHLRENGVDAHPKDLFQGLDITDTLVSRYASGKATGTPCLCGTCVKFRAQHPQWFPAQSA